MTKALAEAISRRPPRANASGEVGANNTVAVTAVSSAFTSLGLVQNGSGFWVTLVCSQDAFIRFGGSSIGLATTSDWFLRAGVAEEYWCESNEDTGFRVIRSTTDSTLYWYRSSR